MSNMMGKMTCSMEAFYPMIVFLLAAWLSLATGDVQVLDLDSNNTAAIIPDMPASFGDDFPKNGLRGRVVMANPINGCGKSIQKAPPQIDGYPWIVVMIRGDCPFTEKVLNAQKANFCSAIVYNFERKQSLTKMGGDSEDITIPSTFVGYDHGMDLAKRFSYPRYSDYLVVISEEEVIDYRMYLWPFAIVVGVCFLMIILFLIIKFVRDQTRTRVARLSKKHLKKIPIRKFKKGQYYDTCAICLDEYEEGEKIRVLPCDHAYHAKCIDPWLTRNKKTCPVCKRRVIPGEDPNSDSSDSDGGGEGTSQTTPLLTNGGGSGPRSHGSMDQQIHPEVPQQRQPRAQSAPALFGSSSVTVEEEVGAVGGEGISSNPSGSRSTNRTRTTADASSRDSNSSSRSGKRRERRGRREGGDDIEEEERKNLLAAEPQEEGEDEEEERKKVERKDRKKKEKKKKSKRTKKTTSNVNSNPNGGSEEDKDRNCEMKRDEEKEREDNINRNKGLMTMHTHGDAAPLVNLVEEERNVFTDTQNNNGSGSGRSSSSSGSLLVQVQADVENNRNSDNGLDLAVEMNEQTVRAGSVNSDKGEGRYSNSNAGFFGSEDDDDVYVPPSVLTRQSGNGRNSRGSSGGGRSRGGNNKTGEIV